MRSRSRKTVAGNKNEGVPTLKRIKLKNRKRRFSIVRHFPNFLSEVRISFIVQIMPRPHDDRSLPHKSREEIILTQRCWRAFVHNPVYNSRIIPS